MTTNHIPQARVAAQGTSTSTVAAYITAATTTAPITTVPGDSFFGGAC